MCINTELLLRLPAEAETFWQRVKSDPKQSYDWVPCPCFMPHARLITIQFWSFRLVFNIPTHPQVHMGPPAVTNNRRFSWHLAVFICCISTRTMPVVEMAKAWPMDSVATPAKFRCHSTMARIFAHRRCWPFGHRGLRRGVKSGGSTGSRASSLSVGLSAAGFRTTFIKFEDACCNVTRQFKVQH